MGATDGRPDPDLTHALPDAPERFELFQAIRLLERLARAGERSDTQVADAAHPADEPVRFRTRPGTAFPAGEVERLDAGVQEGGGGPPELVVNAFGLHGPMGALPQVYTDLLSQQLRERDTGLRDLFDLFNHRLIGLFYRAWAKYRLPVASERAGELEDPISQAMYALIGLGEPGLRSRGDISDTVLLYYGGLFARSVRNADSLAEMLSDDFARPIRVHQFQGQWLRLDTTEISRLGGAHNQLGRDTIAGARVWDVQGAFRLSIGPLSYTEFLAFMPGGTALDRLSQLTRLYVGAGMSFDIQVVLDRDDVPGLCLSEAGPVGPRLGWNTWLSHETPPRDPGDAVFKARETPQGAPE